MRRPLYANGNKHILPLLCALCYFLLAIGGLPAVRAKESVRGLGVRTGISVTEGTGHVGNTFRPG
jgi:hypothetical protein